MSIYDQVQEIITNVGDKQVNVVDAAWNIIEPVEISPDHARLRERFDEIEREIMENKHSASSVFTQMRTAAFYTAPQPEQAAPDVSGLVEALEELMLRAHPAYVGDDLMREKLIVARELGHDALSAYREKRGGNDD